jgi:hypothetical protein
MLARPAGEDPGGADDEAIDKLAAIAALALTIDDMRDAAAAALEELGAAFEDPPPPAAEADAEEEEAAAPFVWFWEAALEPDAPERWWLRELPERPPQRLGFRCARKLEAEAKLSNERRGIIEQTQIKTVYFGPKSSHGIMFLDELLRLWT